METSPKKTGIIYARVSSAEQVDNTSLESQERYCKEYAVREAIHISQVFVERGESAKTADRTEFNKAITFCANKKNKIDYFIVYKVDRFARNQDDHAVVRGMLKRHGTELRSATEPINETPTGRLMEGVMATFAEFDNNVRTERSKGGMLEQIKKGTWVWQAPIGYYRPHKGSNLAKDPKVAPFILMVFEEYAKGTYSYELLAKYLAERGFKTKMGKVPCAQLIEKILKNPLYCGIMRVWGNDYKGNFEPIVPEELFIQCQEGYKKKTLQFNRSVNNPGFPLRRICVCATCQKSLTGSSPKGRKVNYAYYHHHKQDCPAAKFIPRENFEQIFVEYLNELSPGAKYEKIFKAIVLDIWKTNYKKLDENNARIRKDMERLEQERQAIFELHRSGKYSDDEFTEQKAIINQNIYHKRQLLQDNHVEEFNMEEALEYCFRFVRESSKTWLRLKKQSYPRLMRFQKQVFPQKITFDGKKFGTTELSLVLKMNKENGANKSQLVTLPGFEPGFQA